MHELQAEMLVREIDVCIHLARAALHAFPSRSDAPALLAVAAQASTTYDAALACRETLCCPDGDAHLKRVDTRLAVLRSLIAALRQGAPDRTPIRSVRSRLQSRLATMRT